MWQMEPSVGPRHAAAAARAVVSALLSAALAVERRKEGGAGTCCGGNCSCAKNNDCDGSCGCCGGGELASEIDYKLIADDCSAAAVEFRLMMQQRDSLLMPKHAATAAKELVRALPSASLAVEGELVLAVVEPAALPRTTGVMAAAPVAVTLRLSS